MTFEGVEYNYVQIISFRLQISLGGLQALLLPEGKIQYHPSFNRYAGSFFQNELPFAKREPAFAGTPGWYFDWDTGQYWEKGDKPESDARMDPKEVLEEVEKIVREARVRVENVVR